MSGARPLFTGVGVALVTIFDDTLSVDSAATAELAARLVPAGVRAIVVAGTTGEAAALDPDERGALVRAVRSAVPAAVPVIAGTGAATGRQAAALTTMAIDAGADAVLALSPPRVGDPRRYYDAVAKAAGGVPVLAYSYPAVAPPGVPADALPDLPVAGIKDSSGDVEWLLAALSTYAGAVYVGSSALLTAAGQLGAAGAILALANVEPERCAAAFAGDVDAQLALFPAHRAAGGDFPAGLKRLVATRWGFSPAQRIGS